MNNVTRSITDSDTMKYLSGVWDEFCGRIEAQYGKFTNDHLKEAIGNYKQTVGILEKQCNITPEEAKQLIQDAYIDLQKQYETEQQ